MKRTLLLALSLLSVVACSKFDDSAIWDQLSKHEDRIVKLENLCNQINTNITSLQTIIIALQSTDYVVNIAPIKEGNKEIGYTITFAKSGSITIYHGQDGKMAKMELMARMVPTVKMDKTERTELMVKTAKTDIPLKSV